MALRHVEGLYEAHICYGSNAAGELEKTVLNPDIVNVANDVDKINYWRERLPVIRVKVRSMLADKGAIAVLIGPLLAHYGVRVKDIYPWKSLYIVSPMLIENNANSSNLIANCTLNIGGYGDRTKTDSYDNICYYDFEALQLMKPLRLVSRDKFAIGSHRDRPLLPHSSPIPVKPNSWVKTFRS